MSDIAVVDVVEKEKKQYIVVKIGGEHYGFDISYIDNIVRMSKITRVPKAPQYYRGVINLRGEVVPVMSLRRRMNLDDDGFTDALVGPVALAFAESDVVAPAKVLFKQLSAENNKIEIVKGV